MNMSSKSDPPKHASINWKDSRRIDYFGVLPSNLKHCGRVTYVRDKGILGGIFQLIYRRIVWSRAFSFVTRVPGCTFKRGRHYDYVFFY